MAGESKINISFRLLEEHRELGYTKKILEQAEALGMGVNEFARQKLFESLDDDRLDHVTALVEQLHTKVRNLEQNAEQIRLEHSKAMQGILIHVCDLRPDEAQRLIRGDAPL